ncbi:hypothetical protein EHQ94_19825 [Leptospira meyeri]|uniref:hypothetical protein n=1 Tax=Leptospira meyeri TaxID=29508 RepID=UPI001083887C|nr:hypothetical protein [Leptospira meyeri]TGM62923.1 hypothetical protein EHQ94_19825 [Leptospira meyeri]TGM65831.1 hypothetical protein EHQ93_08945 [Leptospira meyeri]
MTNKILILTIHLLSLSIFISSFLSCYQYKFNSILQVKIDKKFEENSNINVIFGDGFLRRNGYNRGMKGISSELENCKLAHTKLSIHLFKYKFLQYKSDEELPINEKKIDLNLMIDSFEDKNEEITDTELIAYSEHRNDILFRIKFNMIRSFAPIYRTNNYHDPGIESGLNLGKEICKLIQENEKIFKKEHK